MAKRTPATADTEAREERELDEMLRICMAKLLETLAIPRDIERRVLERRARVAELRAAVAEAEAR
jgi:hypothetical protein